MFEVSNNKVTMHKGDTGSFVLRLNTTRTIAAADRILFSIKNNKNRIVLQRIYPITDSAVTVTFANEDTDNWEAGTYKMEARFAAEPTMENDAITTGPFIRTPNVDLTLEIKDVIGNI